MEGRVDYALGEITSGFSLSDDFVFSRSQLIPF